MQTRKRIVSLLIVFMMMLVAIPNIAFAADGLNVNTNGEPLGYITMSVEAFTVGYGYLREPMRIPFYANDNLASVTARFLGDDPEDYHFRAKGFVDDGFYLAQVRDGRNQTTAVSDLSIPAYILTASGKAQSDFATRGRLTPYAFLGELDFSATAGWMYTQNGVFPNKGVTERDPSNGDVIRWQYTLYGLGADLGAPLMQGNEEYGGRLPIIPLVSKDELSALLGQYNALPSEAKTYLLESDVEFQSKLNVVKGYLMDLEQVSTETMLAPTRSLQAEMDQMLDEFYNGPTVPDDKADAIAHMNASLATILGKVPSPVFGTTRGEWSVFALARAGYPVPEGYYDGYYNRAATKVANILEEDGSLGNPTEYERLILALASIGKIGEDFEGSDIFTPLADMNYLDQQGINAYVFWLLALDTGDFPVPQDASVTVQATRAKLVQKVIDAQLANGGWAYYDYMPPDPDMTAMAITALAPYYSANPLAKAAVDDALVILSNIQNEQGGYASWGDNNSQSNAQVLVALTAMNIDPDEDQRFIKNGRTVVDALMDYAVEGGGFIDKEGDTAANSMATDQGTYGLVAYWRFKEKMTSLYNMTDVEGNWRPEAPPPAVESGIFLSAPQKISGKQDTTFNIVVSTGDWPADAYKMLDGLFSFPSELEIVDVVPGSHLDGGTLKWNLDSEGIFRFAYADLMTGNGITFDATSFPAELFTIQVKINQPLPENTELVVTATGVTVKADSMTPAEAFDTDDATVTVTVKGTDGELVATARELYRGDDSDLIASDLKAVAVEFVNLSQVTDIATGLGTFYYSEEISDKMGIATYVALVSVDTSLESLSDASGYTFAGDVVSIKFADTNDDGVINAQDALDVVSTWLRKIDEPQGKSILVMNVTADARIDTVDALAIIESFIGGAELAVISK